jgi:hypothetical protein
MTIEDEVKIKNPQLCALVLVECIASPTRYVFNWGQGPKEIFFLANIHPKWCTSESCQFIIINKI